MTTDPIPSAEAAAAFIDKQLPPTWASGVVLQGAAIRAVVAELKDARKRLKRYESHFCTDSTECTELT